MADIKKFIHDYLDPEDWLDWVIVLILVLVSSGCLFLFFVMLKSGEM